MTNITALRGSCPPPFYDVHSFGLDGFVSGRFCAPVDFLEKGLVCCLPCPMTDWIYPPEFRTLNRVSGGLNLAGLVCLLLLLITFIVLPAEKTRRHYLSYCLIIGACFMALGFVIPFGAEPEQCFDEITPNDMYSSLTCAFSGAFIISGGLSMTVWIFIRALSIHLQICWDVVPGQRFFYWAQGLGWAIAATFFTITITITGVSFRFGEICHVNAEHSMGDFWGPLLAISGAATIIQLSTLVYCLKVYLQNAFSDDQTETMSSSGLPSYTNSIRTRSARVIYRRVQKVLWLQWRGIAVVVIVLVDVIFFSVIFVFLNSLSSHAAEHFNELFPYLLCLVESPIDPSPCYHLTQPFTVSDSTIIAILMLLSVAGLQVFFLLLRWEMITGWVDFFREKFFNKREFVSLDAKASENPITPRTPKTQRHYEMKKFEPISPPPVPVTPSTAGFPTSDHYRSGTPDHLSKEAQRAYRSPTLSFSSPRPPSRATTGTQIEWDPRSSHARGGLGLHPPESEEKI